MDPTGEKTEAEAATSTNHDADYIAKALALAFNSESLRVESFHSEPITQRGENFCSVIYRIKVEFRKSEDAPLEQGNYVLKDLLPIVAEVGSNEKLMFQEILPAMAKILQKSSLEEHKLSADCLFVEREPKKEIYLLEDLCALGYASMNRQKGLNLEDAEICVHKLAQFHAASMLLLHEQPELVGQLSPSHYAEGLDDPFAQVIVVNGTAFGADVVAELPGMSKIADKMRAQLPAEYETRIKTVVNGKNTAMPVIVHGDLWLNNLMINAEEKKAIIVDFQNCFIGSAAIDVQFFLYTSLQLDVLLQHREHLLKRYYESLCQTLTALNYTGNTLSYEQLADEMRQCLFYAYYAVVCELPICCASKEAGEDFTVATFMSSEAILAKRRQLFANERVLETLKAILPYFDEQGILDPL
ncbi:hypothetical protein AWZ03_005933 [Drosophila navojoa]|uniref:CHK kinase-like domain-containing protein n=1 Tax=Drosophila navojoa TaxID=7232 RepID=A0A484BIK1_DRONA|nr:uncharacterized protein LOC108651624 [Drosophila navojoa]TDG47635.1 hypothetical protein AWZ03_005933 [Drosophila navojoa]